MFLHIILKNITIHWDLKVCCNYRWKHIKALHKDVLILFCKKTDVVCLFMFLWMVQHIDEDVIMYLFSHLTFLLLSIYEEFPFYFDNLFCEVPLATNFTSSWNLSVGILRTTMLTLEELWFIIQNMVYFYLIRCAFYILINRWFDENNF